MEEAAPSRNPLSAEELSLKFQALACSENYAISRLDSAERRASFILAAGSAIIALLLNVMIGLSKSGQNIKHEPINNFVDAFLKLFPFPLTQTFISVGMLLLFISVLLSLHVQRIKVYRGSDWISNLVHDDMLGVQITFRSKLSPEILDQWISHQCLIWRIVRMKGRYVDHAVLLSIIAVLVIAFGGSIFLINI